MHPLDIHDAQDGVTVVVALGAESRRRETPELAGLSLCDYASGVGAPQPASLAISGSIRGQCGQPACRCAHRDVIDFTFISIGARQDRPASGTKCADGESVVEPIDYFMAIFTGMCIGLAGMAYFWS